MLAQWLGKDLTCQELNRVTILESGAHETLVRERRQPQLTPRLKDYGSEMATQCLKPARIRMARDPGTYVFHMDATFKLNQVAYHVIVCGVSDRCRSFHLVALFITSQRLERLYVKALSSLHRVFTAVTGQQLLVKYVMADAEAGQQNAVNQVFGVMNISCASTT
ncbi:hypothetical protein F443_13826 [Phytophthora nicotianae P1569]|uniref:MULE transposase domain-containing protein n=1 Tax=Phytophthora nicotianae P1569 TaxID=1317065 RepID=V9EPV1_PHYNI|nr:hypothetical protein F443_13826 [Phytophthora nicotianae P1569]